MIGTANTSPKRKRGTLNSGILPRWRFGLVMQNLWCGPQRCVAVSRPRHSPRVRFVIMGIFSEDA